jgi:hypothetical protein
MQTRETEWNRRPQKFELEVATSKKKVSMSLTEDDALGSLQRRLDHALSDGTERQCQGLLDWSMCARRGQMDGQVDRWVSPVQHKLTAVSSDTRL